jgi:hypothetical protein
MRDSPRVKVAGIVGLAFFGIRDQIDDMRIAQRQGGIGQVSLYDQYQLEVLPLYPVHFLAVPIDESIPLGLHLLSCEER